MAGRSTFGSLMGHAVDKDVYLLQTELFGITKRERKKPLKEDAVPSILSYVLEKKLLYLLVSTRAVIGQFSGPYSPVRPAKI